jgi:hypothetical protein
MKKSMKETSCEKIFDSVTVGSENGMPVQVQK